MPFHQVDVHVGMRMRQRRTLLGMSQTKLGDAVGLTFQQVQKYECGSNRMGASRLFEFANVLNVPVAYFFEEMPTKARPAGPSSRSGRKVRDAPIEVPRQRSDPLIKRETLELVRAYYKIRVPGIRDRIAQMIKALAVSN